MARRDQTSFHLHDKQKLADIVPMRRATLVSVLAVVTVAAATYAYHRWGSSEAPDGERTWTYEMPGSNGHVVTFVERPPALNLHVFKNGFQAGYQAGFADGAASSEDEIARLQLELSHAQLEADLAAAEAQSESDARRAAEAEAFEANMAQIAAESEAERARIQSDYEADRARATEVWAR